MDVATSELNKLSQEVEWLRAEVAALKMALSTAERERYEWRIL